MRSVTCERCGRTGVQPATLDAHQAGNGCAADALANELFAQGLVVVRLGLGRDDRNGLGFDAWRPVFEGAPVVVHRTRAGAFEPARDSYADLTVYSYASMGSQVWAPRWLAIALDTWRTFFAMCGAQGMEPVFTDYDRERFTAVTSPFATWLRRAIVPDSDLPAIVTTTFALGGLPAVMRLLGGDFQILPEPVQTKAPRTRRERKAKR